MPSPSAHKARRAPSAAASATPPPPKAKRTKTPLGWSVKRRKLHSPGPDSVAPSVVALGPPQRSRAAEALAEDAKIRWLEQELGLASGNKGKRKLRAEFEADGLEDLADDLDALDDLISSLARPSSDRPKAQAPQPLPIPEDPPTLDPRPSASSIDPDAASNPASSTPAPALAPAPAPARPPPIADDPRLRRALVSILNRLSATSLSFALKSLGELYGKYSRAAVSSALSKAVLDRIAVPESQSAALIATDSAFFSAVRQGATGIDGAGESASHEFLAGLVYRIDQLYPASPSSDKNVDCGKQGANLLTLASFLYEFKLLGPRLIIDLALLLAEQRPLTAPHLEGLLILLKGNADKLRLDDSVRFNGILETVSADGNKDPKADSRCRFMLEALVALKDKRKRPPAGAESVAVMDSLHAALKALKLERSFEPLQASLVDVRNARQLGRWWVTGAGWAGDPLSNGFAQRSSTPGDTNDAEERTEQVHLRAIAKKQGMNTNVRKSIFNALMTAEDYVDAADGLAKLRLTSTQEREVVRVLLHCLGSEKIYNPFYTLVGQQLASRNRPTRTTLQFALWDLLGSLNTPLNGGAGHNDTASLQTSGRRLVHIARAYGWWIGQTVLNLGLLKVVNFDELTGQPLSFVLDLLCFSLLSSQASSPTLTSSAFSQGYRQQALRGLSEPLRKDLALSAKLVLLLERHDLNLPSGVRGDSAAKILQRCCSSLKTALSDAM